MNKLVLTVITGLVVSGLALAAEIPSGLGKGEFVPAFYVCDITGPAKGQELCYRCKFGDRPVVTIFTRKMTPEVTKLAKAFDEVVAKNEDARMAGFLVLMTEEPDAAKATLEEAAKSGNISKIPLTTFKGTKGPAPYKINESAEVTVMMWVDGAVKVSKGFTHAKDLNDAAIASLVESTKEILN
ncbi:MAG: hypothetical protein KatS3mg113_0928 [Planctomycetaceae bacterium]|nr:MAG: hypothetical protein KatS3mg113_0928 [Planctomycetaceae bacterium]